VAASSVAINLKGKSSLTILPKLHLHN